MPVAAWFGAAAIGATLGLLGAGGALLTVPVLVFVVGEPESAAVAESLAIVGAIALTGGLVAARRGRVDGRSVLWLGVPGMLATSTGARLGAWAGGAVQMSIFTAVLLTAAALLLKRRPAPAATAPRASRVALSLRGVAVGLVTGFVGVGGGFMIVPALVILGGLPMPIAVGTSLVIISLNAASGLWTYQALLAGSAASPDWAIVGTFAAVGVAGSLAGQAAAGRVRPAALQRAFAIVLVALGGAMLWRQLVLSG
jgi:uncharacterized membrane protein YfcA